MPTDKLKFFSNYSRRKRVLGQLFLTVTGDFAKVEWTSATFFYGTEDPVFPTALGTFKSQLSGTRFQKREELKYTVRSALAKFGVDFNKDVYSKWMKRHNEVHCMWRLLFR